MDINEHTKPGKLEYYSFLWSILSMLLTSLALFLGGIPPIYKLISSSSGLYGLVSSLLTVSWLISGIAAGYLLYRWSKGGKTLFGGKNSLATTAFFVMIISGFNLGITGITGSNIGFSIFSSSLFLMPGAVIYLATAGFLLSRWKASGKKLF